MPWTTHIDPDVNCVFTKFYGTFEVDQITGAAEDMFNFPEYRVGMNFLRDSREQQIPIDLSYKAISNEAKQMIDKFGDRHGMRCKSALVAGDAQSYAKLHQYIVTGRLSETYVRRKAFRDIEKALRWLDIPEGYEIIYPLPEETA